MRIITQLSTLDRWRRPSARAWSHLGRVLRCEALWKRSGSAKVGGRRRARAHGVAKLTGGHFAPRRDVLRRARSRGARIAADGAAHSHRDAGGRAEQGTRFWGGGWGGRAAIRCRNLTRACLSRAACQERRQWEDVLRVLQDTCLREATVLAKWRKRNLALQVSACRTRDFSSRSEPDVDTVARAHRMC